MSLTNQLLEGEITPWAWWLTPEGEMVDVGDSLTHVNWAVDNVLTHYLDDYSFDYDVNGDQVQDS